MRVAMQLQSRATMVQPLSDVTVSTPWQSYETSISHKLVGCEGALLAGKQARHMCVAHL